VVTCYIAGVDVEWRSMKVIVTFTFCCDNLQKNKFMALEKPGKLREFFSRTLWPPCLIIIVFSVYVNSAESSKAKRKHTAAVSSGDSIAAGKRLRPS